MHSAGPVVDHEVALQNVNGRASSPDPTRHGLQTADASASHRTRRAGGSVSRRDGTTRPPGSWIRILPRSGSVLPRRQSRALPDVKSVLAPCCLSWAILPECLRSPKVLPGDEYRRQVVPFFGAASFSALGVRSRRSLASDVRVLLEGAAPT